MHIYIRCFRRMIRDWYAKCYWLRTKRLSGAYSWLSLLLDTTSPQETPPGDKRKGETKKNASFLSPGHVRYHPLGRYAFQSVQNHDITRGRCRYSLTTFFFSILASHETTWVVGYHHARLPVARNTWYHISPCPVTSGPEYHTSIIPQPVVRCVGFYIHIHSKRQILD